MKTLILKNIVKNSISNEEGTILFNSLNDAYLNDYQVILYVESDMSMSSSFLNTSVGLFLETYGIDVFKNTVKFKGSRNQYARISEYISKYCSIYLV